MRNFVVLAVAASIALASCGGRDANPVARTHVGDEELSCTAIETEIAEIDARVQELIPQTNKTGKNVALGVAGWFLLVPWFFMDLSDSEQIEIQAYRERRSHLIRIADRKNCQSPVTAMAQ